MAGLCCDHGWVWCNSQAHCFDGKLSSRAVSWASLILYAMKRYQLELSGKGRVFDMGCDVGCNMGCYIILVVESGRHIKRPQFGLSSDPMILHGALSCHIRRLTRKSNYPPIVMEIAKVEICRGVSVY